MDSCHLTFSPKGSVAKIGFAPLHVAAALPAGSRLSSFGDESRRCIYVCRCADDPGQTVAGRRCQTEFVYSSVLLRCGLAMPSRHRTRAHFNEWNDIGCKRRSQVRPCASTTRIALVSFPDGLASKTQLRSMPFVAARGGVINNHGS